MPNKSPKPEADKTVVLNFRVTEEFSQRFRAYCEERSINMSGFIRAAVEGSFAAAKARNGSEKR